MTSGSQYISLFNETTGDFDILTVQDLIVDTITVDSATINALNATTAIITTETVNTSSINNLTVGNAIYFPDGTAALPSIAFTNDHSTGIYRYGTEQIGLSTGGTLRGLVSNNGLVSAYNVYAALQFLCNSGSVSAPSYSFVGDPSTGVYASAAGVVSFASSGNQVLAVGNSSVYSLRDVYGSRFISTGNGSLGSPALEIGSGSIGFYRSGSSVILGLGGIINVQFVSGYGISPGNLGYSLGNPGAEWGNIYVNNIFSTSSSIGAITCTSITNSGTSTLSGAVTCGSINAGTNSCTVGTLSTSSISNSGTSTLSGTVTCGSINAGTNSCTMGALSSSSLSNSGTSSLSGAVTCGSINAGTNSCTVGALSTSSFSNSGTSSLSGAVSCGSINAGTNSCTVGSLTTSSITNSGTSTLTGAVSCGPITSTGNIINGTNSITTSSITNGSSNRFTLTSNVGSTTTGFSSFLVDAPSPNSGDIYGFGINKSGIDLAMIGINKNTATGQLPASAIYYSSFRPNSNISFGRGNGTGLPDKSDILIDASGAITLTNNILQIRACTTSQSISATSPVTFTTFNSSIVSQGNTTYSTGVWTIGTAGVYQCSYDITWEASSSGYRQSYINATAGLFAHSIISSPGAIVFPQSGSASIKCAIGDTISLAVYQSSGGPLNIAPSGSYPVRFSIVKIQ